MSQQSRRNFIKKGVMGLAGATVLPSVLTAEGTPSPTPPSTPPSRKPKLIYRTMGKTGLKVPIVSMGVMNANNPNLVQAALDAGIKLLDTAWYYQRGLNEEMIGKVIKGRDRDSFYISTKVFEPRDEETDLFPPDAKPDTFIAKFETSLKRLGTDHVEILYLHSISRKESVTFEPYLNAMKKLKKEGKVRFIGVSTHTNEAEVIRATVDCKEYDMILTSYNFKQKNLTEVQNAIAYAAKAGLGIMGMKTQAGVYWDGKEKKYPINMKAALKWALQNENIHTAIPGFITFDQMELDLSVMEDLTLTPQEKADLNPPKMGEPVAGLYCQQCEKCIPQCPKRLNIPTLMRSYMYAYGYKNPGLAKETLETITIPSAVCTRCPVCSVSCTMGFDIKNRVQDIARLSDVPADFLA
ncbi:MAG: aldo/keto reductase [Candidatus Omnitrophota bacterium]